MAWWRPAPLLLSPMMLGLLAWAWAEIAYAQPAIGSTAINQWSVLPVTGVNPGLESLEQIEASANSGGRIFHATATVGSLIYLHGGFVPGTHAALPSAMWKFDAVSFTWSLSPATGIAPANRAFHTMVTLTMFGEPTPVIFGGIAMAADFGFDRVLGDAWYFLSHAAGSHFVNLSLSEGSIAPVPRFGHNAISSGGTMYVLGGCLAYKLASGSADNIFCKELADTLLWRLSVAEAPNGHYYATWKPLSPAVLGGMKPFFLAMDTVADGQWYIFLGSKAQSGGYQSLALVESQLASDQPTGVLLDLPLKNISVAMRGTAVTMSTGAISLLVTVKDAGTTLVTPTQVTNYEVVVDLAARNATLVPLPNDSLYSLLSVPSEPFTGAGLFSGGMTANIISDTVFVYGFFYSSTRGITMAAFWQYVTVTVPPELSPQANSLPALAAANASTAGPSRVVIWSLVSTEDAPTQRYALSTFTVRAAPQPETEAYQIMLLGGSQRLTKSPFMWMLNFQGNLSNSYWTSKPVSGPSARSYSAALPYLPSPNQNMSFIMYGGIPPVQVTPLNDIWAFNGTAEGSGLWHQVCAEATELPRRAAYAAIYVFAKEQILIYGGWSTVANFPLDSVNTLVTINLTKGCNSSTELQPHMPGLAQVGSVSAFLPSNHHQAMLVFGGLMPNGTMSNALFMYDTVDNTWTTLSHNKNITGLPLPRVGSAVAYVGTKFIVVGGASSPNYTITVGRPLDDLWYFDLLEGQWTQLQTVSSSNSLQGLARFGAGISVVKQTVLIFSGLGQVNNLFRGYDYPLSITVGCNPGSASMDFWQKSCVACAPGYYSSTPGASECKICPGDSFTSGVGATSEEQCDICQPSVCTHGTCHLGAGQAATCVCNFGYTDSQCSTAWLLIFLGCLLGSLLLVSPLILCYRHHRRGYSELTGRYQAQQEQLLNSKIELEDLRHVFDIHETELVFKQRIDSGSEGAFGEVWQADWHDRQVAVKKLRANVLAFDDQAFEDFEKEVGLLQLVRHRNIVYFFGAGVMGETPFLVLEYCTRGSLYSVLSDMTMQLTPQRRLGFALDTASGMNFLHSLNPPRIHRDLKSFNLLVSASFVVKIGDFGTAKKLDQLPSEATNTISATPFPSFLAPRPLAAARSYSRPSSMASFDSEEGYGSRNGNHVGFLTTAVGTVRWSSPELLRCEPYGLKTDVYSYGMVLYEIETRRCPYMDIDHVFEVRTAILNGQRPDLPATTSPTLAGLAHRCWQAEAEQRPTFAEVIEVLESISLS